MIEALKLDPSKLSPADEITISRAGILKLQLSDLEAAALAGKPIDTAKFCATSEMFEALLRHKHAAAVNADGVSVTLESARRRMAELLNVDLLEDEGRQARQEWEAKQARIAELERENAELKERLASAPQPSSSSTPANVVPMKRAEPPRQMTVHDDAYARREYEPWRGFVGLDGVMTPSRRMQPDDWSPKW